MITGGTGRKQQIVFRYSRGEQPPPVEPEEGSVQRRQAEEPAISTTKPILLSAVDDRTKASGLYRVSLANGERGATSSQATDAPSKLVMLEKAFGVPIKARDADVYVFTLSRFDEFPNLWVSSGAFADASANCDSRGLNAVRLARCHQMLSRIADVYVSAHPNAGLPNAMAEYDEEPCETAHFIREWAESGWLNITGGCCGTTPDHIREIVETVAEFKPRIVNPIEPRLRRA